MQNLTVVRCLALNIEEWKKQTGAKRFKRTKEEMALGLSPQEALDRRLAESLSGDRSALVEAAVRADDGNVTAGGGRRSGKSKITIEILAKPGTDTDYFEHVPGNTVTVTMNEKWYAWFDNLSQVPYDGDVARLIRHIVDAGLNTLIAESAFRENLHKYDERAD